jgi:anti-sigma regulatory factor (Ser/Thr protein kinase)
MEMTAYNVEEPSQVGEVRRAVLARSAQLGFDEETAGTAALLATEAGTNLVKHAGGGTILLHTDDETGGLDLLVLDRGPGLADPVLAFTDGLSTSGTAGLGLGSLRRLASAFDMHSAAGHGTALLLRVGPRAAFRRAPMLVGVVAVPSPREDVCGDLVMVHQEMDRTVCMVADGLGHGVAAREAARAAIDGAFARVRGEPAEQMRAAHDAARHTRGAALLVVEIDRTAGVVRACGVGNISGQVLADGRAFHLVSTNGIVGVQLNKVQQFQYPWDGRAVLVMHSDGLAHRWGLDGYGGWRQRHPLLVAGLLYRDHRRGRDDVSVLVARQRHAGED